MSTPENKTTRRIEIDLPADYSEETYEQLNKFVEYFKELGPLFAAKQEAYGKGNIAKFGGHGVTIRLNDKLERIINLTFNDRVDHVEDDSVRDAWRDVAVYGIIGLMCFDDTW